MKAKSSQPPSELEAKEKLIVYVFEYLNHVGANKAAELFLEEIRYDKAIKLLNNDDKNAFLSSWWFVFWDLYCAAPEKRASQPGPEPTVEGRTFYDYHIRNSMSPNILQTSPPQQAPHYMGPSGPQPGPPMYGPPSIGMSGHMRPMGNRLPQGHGPPPPPGPRGPHFMSVSPRYAPMPHPQMHPGPPAPPNMQNSSPAPNVMMNMGPGSVPEPCGPSPGVSRLTPSGHVSGGSMPPQMAPGPSPSGSGGQMMPSGPPSVNSMPGPSPQSRPPQPPGPQQGGWQGNVNYGVSSPAGQQQCYVQGPPPVQGVANQQPDMGSMMMNDRGMMDVKNSPANGVSTPHPDDFLLPNFSHDNDQSESAEIMKVKQSLQDETKKYEQDKPDFNMDYSDSQNKWNNI